MSKFPGVRAAVLLPFLAMACAYGPKAERKSPLNYLNGENYDTNPGGGPDMVTSVPFVKRKEKLTQLKGVVALKDGFVILPLKNITLDLYSKKGEKLLNTTSDLTGTFIFSGIIPNGPYEIRIQSTQYSGSLKLDIGEYLLENLTVPAKKTSL